MGWFWGSNKDDPTTKLDPELRAYLEQQTPARYTPVQTPREPPRAPEPPQPTPSSEAEDGAPTVPSASLFPDGRYAHLWKTYKPPEEIEDTPVSGAQRVIESYKKRRDTVHRAAMENCVLEHEALTLCFQRGSWQDQLRARATMCSDENATFSRCYTMQAKFLQALGYASAAAWDDEREERIQMHADKLYHQMLDYERQVDEAHARGVEPPPLTSLFDPTAQTPGAELPPGWKPSKPLDELTPHERELELRAHQAQLEQQRRYAEEASPFMRSQEEARRKRQEKAIRWFGETVGKWIT
ncbi:hypothetical protein VTN02DRAFT_5937 [Thermoascus thermophilus]